MYLNTAGRSVRPRQLAVRAGVCLGVALWWLSVSAVICFVVSVSGAVLSWVEILGEQRVSAGVRRQIL